jgi:hypothetical protein
MELCDFILNIRENGFLAQDLIKEEEYLASMKPIQNMLLVDAKYIFGSKIKIITPELHNIFDTNYYYPVLINNKNVSITFDSEKYEYYKYKPSTVSLPKNCKAPSLFEGLHHALQYCFANYKELSYDEFHKKNTTKIEECAYYWRINVFPEDKYYKDSIITPSNFEWILEKDPEEIILIEKEIIY